MEKPILSIVDTSTCAKLAGTTEPFILALKKDENLFAGIVHCAEQVGLKAASISGLGAIDDVTVAYYHLETKKYHSQLFKGTYELVSLNGNIAIVDGKPFVHIHAALGTEEFNVIGGHIMDATVGPSAEITIIPLAGTIGRKYSEEIGLKLLCAIG